MTPAAGGRLVGRAGDLDHLVALIEGLRDTSAVTVLIEGEAGIGKTRLLTSAIAAARGCGMDVFHAAAHPLERTRPFGVLVDALDLRRDSGDPRRAALGRLLVGEVPPGSGELAAGQLQFRVIEGIIDLVEVASSARPVVLALDDLHWADASTLLAFRWMTRQLTQVPLLLVATLRPSPRSAELAQVLDESVDAGAREIRLAPMAGEDVRELVEATVGLPPGPALVDAAGRAGGNPLLVVEMLRSLRSEGQLDVTGASAEIVGAGMPNSLRQLVLRRLRHLPDETVGTLRSASLLGDSFSLVDLGTITRRDPGALVEELREAIAAGLLADDDGVLVFRHQLVRDAVYEDIPTAARVALHRDAGRALEAAGAPPSRVAGQLLLGSVEGDVEACESLRRAARAAAPRAPAVAVELLRRAEALLPAGHPERDPVLRELVEALFRAGQVVEGARIAEEVLGRAHDERLDRPLRLAMIEALSIMARPRELVAQTEALLARDPEMPLADRAFVLTQGSMGRTFSGDPVGGERDCLRALELAERAGDPETTTWSLAIMSVAVKTQGRFGEAVELAERATRVAAEAGDVRARMRLPTFMRAMALCDADLMEDATRAIQRADQECEDLGVWWLLPDIRLVSAELRFLLGDWDEAVLDLEGGVEFAREHGNMILVPRALACRALIASARGDHAAGSALLAPVWDEFVSGRPGLDAPLVGHAVSVLAEDAGEPERALEVLEALWRGAPRHNRYAHRSLGPALVRLALAHDRRPLAIEVAASTEAAAELSPDVPSVRSAARRCHGMIERDPGAMLDAVELARRGRRVVDLAAACADAATVFGDRGRTADAQVLLAEALDVYEAIGADAYAARMHARLRGLGVRRASREGHARALTGWDSLTRSERAVAELVAAGLTNREVATRLFISPHTVNSHLRHIFPKLGVSSRAAMAAEVTRSRLSREDGAFE